MSSLTQAISGMRGALPASLEDWQTFIDRLANAHDDDIRHFLEVHRSETKQAIVEVKETLPDAPAPRAPGGNKYPLPKGAFTGEFDGRHRAAFNMGIQTASVHGQCGFRTGSRGIGLGSCAQRCNYSHRNTRTGSGRALAR